MGLQGANHGRVLAGLVLVRHAVQVAVHEAEEVLTGHFLVIKRILKSG